MNIYHFNSLSIETNAINLDIEKKNYLFIKYGVEFYQTRLL